MRPLQEVTISVEINSKIPLSNVYSPSHNVSVRKEGKGKARVGFEGKNIKPEKDFILYYSLSEDDIGLSIMNWDGPEDNYYILLDSLSYVGKKVKILNKYLIFSFSISCYLLQFRIIPIRNTTNCNTI